MEEIWPFHCEATGCKIHADKFYGFSDSGSTYTTDQPTREAAIADIKRVYSEVKDSEISTNPDDLGAMSPVVVSGREYVRVLKERDILLEIGHWSE